MKKIAALCTVFLTMLIATSAVQAHEDIDGAASCLYCGMDRTKFAHSRMLLEYDDGTTVGTCSIHCSAIDLANNIDKTPLSIGVGDYTSKELIEAESAFWVIGGSKSGVMTKRAKWAFGSKESAEQFIQENGGTLATFDAAMKAAYEDLWEDTKMIREKRKMKRMKAAEAKENPGAKQ